MLSDLTYSERHDLRVALEQLIDGQANRIAAQRNKGLFRPDQITEAEAVIARRKALLERLGGGVG